MLKVTPAMWDTMDVIDRYGPDIGVHKIAEAAQRNNTIIRLLLRALRDHGLIAGRLHGYHAITERGKIALALRAGQRQKRYYRSRLAA